MDIGLSPVLENWYGTLVIKSNGEWNRTEKEIMLNFAESGHPVFWGISPSARGVLKSYGSRKKWTWRTHGSERPTVIGMHAERSKGGLWSSSNPKLSFQNINMNRGIRRKRNDKRMQFGKKHHCFQPRHQRVERECESAKKDVSSLQSASTPCVDNHLIPAEDFEVKGVFFAVCPPDCVEMLVLCRIWEARFASVSQHFGTVSHK